MNEEIDETPGFSRRDMLRKTAIVGGALVWTAPAVQSLAGPAFAQTAGSPRGAEVCTYYAVSIDISRTGTFTCADASNKATAPGSTDCIKTGATNYAAAITGGCSFVTGVTLETNGNWTVILKPETDASKVQGFSKCNKLIASCTPVTASDGPKFDTLVFTPCPKPLTTGNGTDTTQDISNVQIVFCVPR